MNSTDKSNEIHRIAVALSLATGLGSTLLALALTMLICAGWQGTRAFRWLERALSPLLSVPHAAAAFGLAFLIAPSGWVARALAQLMAPMTPGKMAPGLDNSKMMIRGNSLRLGQAAADARHRARSGS